MLRKILIGLAVLVAVLAMAEIVALLALRGDKRSFAEYWQQRAGQATPSGDTDTFVYVALGDSAAQGLGASAPEKGYVGLLADAIGRQTGRPVHVINLSVSGARLQDLLDNQLPQLAQYQPDLITMEIGANDMGGYDEATFRAAFESILQRLPADRTVVSNMPYFGGIIRPGDSPDRASRVIAELTARDGFMMAELYQPLQRAKNRWIYAADFFHPNDTGYRIWYEAFWPPVRDKL